MVCADGGRIRKEGGRGARLSEERAADVDSMTLDREVEGCRSAIQKSRFWHKSTVP